MILNKNIIIFLAASLLLSFPALALFDDEQTFIIHKSGIGTGGNVTYNLIYYNVTRNLTNNITYYYNTTYNLTNNITASYFKGNWGGSYISSAAGQWNDSTKINTTKTYNIYKPATGNFQTWMNMTCDENDYCQIKLKNKDSGANASSCYILERNDGTESSNYAEWCMNSNGYIGTNDTINERGASSLNSYGMDTLISAQSPGSYVAIAAGGTTANNLKFKATQNGVYLQTLQLNFLVKPEDFIYFVAAKDDFVCSALSSGTAASSTGDNNHIGVFTMSDSTTANGGYICRTDATIQYFGGGETFRYRFKPNTNVLNTTIIMGFGDSTTAAEPTDGCYLYSFNLVVYGRCKNNAGPTSTSTSYTMTAGTWYTAIGRMNSAATSMNFSIYNDAGNLLWTNTVSANIPSTSARVFGYEHYAFQSTTSAAAILVYWDSREYWIDRRLTRGPIIQE